MACGHLSNVCIAQVNLEQLKVKLGDARSRPRRSLQRPRDDENSDHRWNCVACGAGAQPWMCLSCGLIHCSRSENQDALRHYSLYKSHCIAMSCNDTSVFCYECDEFICDDTEDSKIDSVRRSLRTYNKARAADHLYSLNYHSYEDGLDSQGEEGTEEEDVCVVHSTSPHSAIFVVDEESASVPEDDISIGGLAIRTPPVKQGPLHISASAPALGKVGPCVVKGGHMLRARKRKISPQPINPLDGAAHRDVPYLEFKRRGLANLGNTCFVNAVLQALTSIDWFREFMAALPLLEADTIEPPSEFRAKKPFYHTRRATAQIESADNNTQQHLVPIFAEMLRQTINEIINHRANSHEPDSFFQAVWRLNPRFRGFQQQDSHEFLRMMLDKVHSDLRKCRIPEDVERRFASQCGNASMGATESAISRLFEGALLSQVICLTCRSASNIQDPFLDLSLEMIIPPQKSHCVPLFDCLEQFFAKEELDHCEQYMCARCGERRPSTKQLFLKSTPNVLCLHLKRFRWGSHRGKLDYMVDFPLEGLDMTPYMAPNTGRGESHVYDLCSIVVHQGSGISSGHYTAYGRSGGQWWHFNDDRVKLSTPPVVLKQKAYLLFYMRRQNNT